MKLDLSKFHKIECDDKCTVLQHPNGHQIKIAHSGLKPEHKKELDAVPMKMAKGGMSKPSKPSDAKPMGDYPQSKMPRSEEYSEPDDQGSQDAALAVLRGMTKQMPPFGPMGAEKPHYPPCINPSCKSYGHSHPNCRCYGGKAPQTAKAGQEMKFADGGQVPNFCSENREHDQSCQYFAEKGMVDEPSAPEEPQASTPPSEEPQEQPSGPAIDQMPEPDAQQAQQDPQVNANPEQTGAQPAQDMVPPEVHPAVEHAQKVNALLNNEIAQTSSDVKSGAIHPKTYNDLLWKDKSTLGKIGTFFGLLIGGAGAGLAGQQSAILHMMDNTIQRDLEAQQQSQGNEQNLLRINQQNLANNANVSLTQQQARALAVPLTYIQKQRSALDQMSNMTTKMPEGPQKQQAMQTLAGLSQMVDTKQMNLTGQAAMSSALMGQMSGASGQGQPNTTLMKSGMLGEPLKEVGNDIEQKTLSGVPEVKGQQAARPIPQQQRDQVQAMQVLDTKAKQLMKFAKDHEGTWNPQTRAKAQQMANEMVGFYSSSLGTSMTEGNRNWLDEQIAKKNPTSAIAQTLYGSQARLKEIADSNNMRKQNLLQTVGFQPQQKESAAQMKVVNGIQYKRGPGGEAIKVK